MFPQFPAGAALADVHRHQREEGDQALPGHERDPVQQGFGARGQEPDSHLRALQVLLCLLSVSCIILV